MSIYKYSLNIPLLCYDEARLRIGTSNYAEDSGSWVSPRLTL